MRSEYDEQAHGRPADDLEVGLEVREAPAIVAGRKELPEAVVGSLLESVDPPQAGPTCLPERLPACTRLGFGGQPLEIVRPSLADQEATGGSRQQHGLAPVPAGHPPPSPAVVGRSASSTNAWPFKRSCPERFTKVVEDATGRSLFGFMSGTSR